MGVRNGSRLRIAPGQTEVVVTLDAIGGNGQHYWLLDGKQSATPNATKKQSFHLTGEGAHNITVIDAAGHVDSVGFSLDKK
jgi:penicillin-binding protein 1C